MKDFRLASRCITENTGVIKAIIIKTGEGINDYQAKIGKSNYVLHKDSFILGTTIYIKNNKGKYVKIIQSRDFMPTNELHLLHYSNFKPNMEIRGRIVDNKFKITTIDEDSRDYIETQAGNN